MSCHSILIEVMIFENILHNGRVISQMILQISPKGREVLNLGAVNLLPVYL